MKKNKKLVKIDIEKFLEAGKLFFSFRKLSAKQIDYSCVFEKDLTIKQKRELSKHMDIKNLLDCMILFPGEYGGKRRKDLKVTHYPEGTWGAEIVKPKANKQELVDKVIEQFKKDFLEGGDENISDEFFREKYEYYLNIMKDSDREFHITVLDLHT